MIKSGGSGISRRKDRATACKDRATQVRTDAAAASACNLALNVPAPPGSPEYSAQSWALSLIFSASSAHVFEDLLLELLE